MGSRIEIDLLDKFHEWMARKPRFEFPSAIHHVVSRSNNRKVLFSEKGSGKAFEKAMFEALESNNLLLHAYTIMSNHYHLLLETPEGNLSSGMQWLQGTFAKIFVTGKYWTYHNLPVS